MRDNLRHVDEVALRDTYRAAIRTQIAHFDWHLLPEDELIERIFSALPAKHLPDNLDTMIRSLYTVMLYEACRQSADLALHERGYADLFRYIYRAAHNKWPDIAEDVTQRT